MPSFEDAVEALDRRVTVCARFSEAAFLKRSSYLLSMVPTSSPCKLLRNSLGKQSIAAEHDSVVHQLKQHVFSLMVDGHQVSDIDNEFAATKLGSGSLTGLL
jgi:hypothetical protein